MSTGRGRYFGGIGAALSAVRPPIAFDRSEIEAAFLAEHARMAAPQRRAASVLALLVWLAYGGADLGVDPLHPLMQPVNAICAAVLLVCVALTFQRPMRNERYAEGVMVIIAIICFASLVRRSPGVDPLQASGLSFIANVISLLFICLAFRLRAAVVIVLLAGCGHASAINYLTSVYDMDAPSTILAGAAANLARSPLNPRTAATIFYQAAFVLAGYLAVVELERKERTSFLREQRLKEANSELVATRAEVERTTDALLIAKEALRRQAEDENRGKSKFLADAAHDLSQPMHAASLFVQTARHALERGDLSKGVDLVEKAGSAVRLARSSFADILEISQLESGLIAPKYTVFDLDALIAEVAASLRVVADDGGVELRLYRRKVGGVLIHSDRTLLARVLTNLISNAIKYADPAKGSQRAVLVGVVKTMGTCRVVIADNGVGIDPGQWVEVFKPFVQLGNPERNRERGLGVGLSVVKSIADLLDGHAVAMSSRVGRGTRFTVRLPLHDEGPTPALPVGLLKTAQEAFGALFVWCIEDDELSREATKSMLDELGVLNETADSFGQFERDLPVYERAPDLVITDYRLEDGRTASDVAVQLDARWPDTIPVLVMTGEPSGVSHDVSGRPRLMVLRKPVEPEAFVEAIRTLCLAG